MEIRNKAVYGLQTRETRQADGTYVTSTSRPNAGSLFLSHSAVIHGSDRTTPHPWSYNISNLGPVSGRSVTIFRPTGRIDLTITGDFIPQQFYDPGNNTSLLYNQALSRLGDKVRGGLDLSVDLAQSGQVLRMARADRRFFDFMGNFTRRRFNGLKSLGEAYLEAQYGWRPLVQSIYDARNEAVRQVLNSIKKFEATSSRGVTQTYRNVQFPNGQTAFTALNPKGIEAVKISVELFVKESSFSLERWTSLNPASIAWEVMPYSFVVDWFYDVGGYLRSLETALLSQTVFRSGYVSTLRSIEISPRWPQKVRQVGNYNLLEEYHGSARLVTFSRTLLSSYPFPRPPVFKAQLGPERLLSAASLLALNLKSGYRIRSEKWDAIK